MHTFSGRTRDFIAFFGTDLHGIVDCKAPPGLENDPWYRVGISVEPDTATRYRGKQSPDIRFRYSMRRPGQLLLQFAALA
eukprot:2273852-Rhodomonas_salina.1